MLSAAGLCLTAFIAATLSGALGLGGGTLLVAVLFATGMPPAQAVPLFALVQLVANGARSVTYLRQVRLPALAAFAATSLPAALLFAPLAERVATHWVQILLGGVILGSLLLRRASTPARPRLPQPLAFGGAGLLDGSVGMFIGATGMILGRIVLRPDWPRIQVVGTIAATQALGHLIKLVGFAAAGALLLPPALAAAMCLSAVAGTLLGTRLGDRLPEAGFRRVFRIVLLLLAAHLAIDGIMGAWTSS